MSLQVRVPADSFPRLSLGIGVREFLLKTSGSGTSRHGTGSRELCWAKLRLGKMLVGKTVKGSVTSSDSARLEIRLRLPPWIYSHNFRELTLLLTDSRGSVIHFWNSLD